MKLIEANYKNIDNIIFDLGNVLMDIDISLTLNQFKKIGVTDLKDEDIHPHQKGCFLDIETGHISTQEFLHQIKEQYPQAQNIADSVILDAWNALLLPFEMERFDLLDKIHSNYKVYLLSNTNLPHRICYLETFRRQSGGREFETYFDKAYYSDMMLMRKPDKQIYDYVINDAKIDPTRTLFIDDNDCNFSGAREAGLNCLHLKKVDKVVNLFK